MRIAWFLSGDLTVVGDAVSSVLASNRLRCLELLKALEANGHEVKLVPVDKIETLDLSKIVACDIAIVGKVFRDMSMLYRVLKDHGVVIIADICDDPFAMSHLRAAYESLIYWCDTIVVSSSTLAISLRQYTNKSIATIADCLEAEIVSPQSISPSSDMPLILLWFGQPANLQGLINWLPALNEYSRRQLKLCLVTRIDPKLRAHVEQWQAQYSRLEISLEPWSLERAVTALEDCDVVLIPSILDSGTVVKTANRLQRALCAGKAVIASPVPSFLELQPFVHISESVDTELDAILDDVSGEAERVAAGQAFVVQRYAAQQIASQWHDCISKIHSAGAPSLIDQTANATFSERHLMIFWNNALSQIEPLMAELMGSSFVVEAVIKTSWTASKFSENLAGFYEKSPTDISSKLSRIGVGDFVVVIFRDDAPNHGYRVTSRGVRVVNLNVFDAKTQLRLSFSEPDLIHATNDQAEFDHDFSTLFPLSLRQSLLSESGNDWTGAINEYAGDVAGEREWESLADLFDVLNKSVNYVVLRNFDCLPAHHDNAIHGDIDLLVEDFERARARLGAKKVFADAWRVHVEVRVAGEPIRFDLRYLGDDYFDQEWQRQVLDRKIVDQRGFYRPDPVNHFYTLIHHIVVNKRFIAPDYVTSLIDIGMKFGFNNSSEQWQDRAYLMQVLARYMKNNGFRFRPPNDRSVNFLVEANTKPPEAPLSDLDYLAAAVMETERLEPLYQKKNAYFHSKIWRVALPGRQPIAIKRVTSQNVEAFQQLSKEHEFLVACKGEGIVECLDHCVIDNEYILITAWVDGFNLWDEREQFLALDPMIQKQFWQALESGINRIAAAKVKHRDLWAKNVIVQKNRPVIIDFGWACFESERAPFTPDSLRCPSDATALKRMQQEILTPASNALIN